MTLYLLFHKQQEQDTLQTIIARNININNSIYVANVSQFEIVWISLPIVPLAKLILHKVNDCS